MSLLLPEQAITIKSKKFSPINYVSGTILANGRASLEEFQLTQLVLYVYSLRTIAGWVSFDRAPR